ncbi:unnamed protein product [Polarella glacialis]|uniref:Uncharacterized protein n=1 Tax=Polarella glacialis TaxID=89957 RepID=A0A813F7J9_POLGL|nr:unnamed protein product [Polarella glacialis]
MAPCSLPVMTVLDENICVLPAHDGEGANQEIINGVHRLRDIVAKYDLPFPAINEKDHMSAVIKLYNSRLLGTPKQKQQQKQQQQEQKLFVPCSNWVCDLAHMTMTKLDTAFGYRHFLFLHSITCTLDIDGNSMLGHRHNNFGRTSAVNLRDVSNYVFEIGIDPIIVLQACSEDFQMVCNIGHLDHEIDSKDLEPFSWHDSREHLVTGYRFVFPDSGNGVILFLLGRTGTNGEQHQEHGRPVSSIKNAVDR